MRVSRHEVGFIYASAKDTLKWNNLSVKEHIGTVMSIGNLLSIDDKSFNEFKNRNYTIEVTKEELDEIYAGFRK